jgi:acyl-coenzyme A synthetase/AMP-(fatty) acid ligase
VGNLNASKLPKLRDGVQYLSIIDVAIGGENGRADEDGDKVLLQPGRTSDGALIVYTSGTTGRPKVWYTFHANYLKHKLT